jgi:hypothetical protein
VASLKFKEEKVLQSASMTNPLLVSHRLTVAKTQNLSQRFAEWRSDGTALEHPGVITWPIAVASVVLTGLGYLLGNVSADVAPAVSAWILYLDCLFFGWIVMRLSRRGRRLRHLERVQLEPGDAAVEVAISKDGVVIGRDIGYLRFEAGCIFFQGTSTTFSFSRATVVGIQRRRSFNRLYLAGLSSRSDRIKYRVGQTTYEIGLSPIRTTDSVESVDYSRALSSWKSENIPADGVDVFPPCVPSPSTFVEVRNELAAPFFVFTLFASACAATPGPYTLGSAGLDVFWVWLFVAFSVLPSIRVYRRIKLAQNARATSRIKLEDGRVP